MSGANSPYSIQSSSNASSLDLEAAWDTRRPSRGVSPLWRNPTWSPEDSDVLATMDDDLEVSNGNQSQPIGSRSRAQRYRSRSDANTFKRQNSILYHHNLQSDSSSSFGSPRRSIDSNESKARNGSVPYFAARQRPSISVGVPANSSTITPALNLPSVQEDSIQPVQSKKSENSPRAGYFKRLDSIAVAPDQMSLPSFNSFEGYSVNSSRKPSVSAASRPSLNPRPTSTTLGQAVVSPPMSPTERFANFSFSPRLRGRSVTEPVAVPVLEHPTLPRLNTDPPTQENMMRKPSVAQEFRRNTIAGLRKMSVMALPAPDTPARPRAYSVSNLAFYVSKVQKQDVPIFSTSLSKVEIESFMEDIKKRQDNEKKPTRWWSKTHYRWVFRFGILVVIYLFLVGRPIWPGFCYIIYKFLSTQPKWNFAFVLFLGWGAINCWLPLLFASFEGDPTPESIENRDPSNVALVIPAYKAATALPATLEHALLIFPAKNIFVIANGNSKTPLDDTADVCKKYNVNHTWVPVGSKITAEFVGCAMAKKFDYVMLIDDDVHLPPNLPLVVDRFNEKTKCIGYTIQSTGPNGSKGTVWQQCQDMEYKSAGLSRIFGGKYGSATFPHGAIILWDRKVLMSLFWSHPGYAISEDWYFGMCARSSGYRIEFTSQVFVETETPSHLFFPPQGGARAGYGEMTVWKQRFYRWNFFHIYRIWDDLVYLIFSWRLGFRYEIVTKYQVFQEVVESWTLLSRPLIMPISLVTSYQLSLELLGAILVLYAAGAVFLNGWHLRRKGQMIAWSAFPAYFWMKFALTFVDTASVFYAIWKYAEYFEDDHLRLVDNYMALEAAKTCFDQVVNENLDRILEEEEGEEIVGGKSAISETSSDASCLSLPEKMV